MVDDASKRQGGTDPATHVREPVDGEEEERPGEEEERPGEGKGSGRTRSWAREGGTGVREASRETARELRMRAEERTDRWTSVLGDEVTSIAHAFRDAGETLEEEGKPRIAGWSRAGADGVERLAGYLRDENPRAMIDDLSGFARSNPALFAGTTLLGGLLLGRFLRSSEPEGGSRRPETGSGPEARQPRPGKVRERPEGREQEERHPNPAHQAKEGDR